MSLWSYGQFQARSTMTQLDSVKNHEKVDVKVDDSKIKLVLGCVNFQQLSAI